MKKVLNQAAALLLLTVFLLCLYGCTQNEKNFPVPLSVTDRSALELCFEKYEDSELEQIYDFMTEDTTAFDLHEKYEIVALRQDRDSYRVIYEGQKNVLALRFDAQGRWIPTEKQASVFKMTATRGVFDDLNVGDSVAAVRKADSAAFYPFLGTDSDDLLVSEHYTQDGYYTRVTYEKTADDYIVLSVDTGIM